MSSEETLRYRVPGVSCGHCRAAIASEVGRVPGVQSVEVDLEAKTVAVEGIGLDDTALRGAIDDAGYDVAEVS